MKSDVIFKFPLRSGDVMDMAFVESSRFKKAGFIGGEIGRDSSIYLRID